jgi:hypothetical protein
MSREMNILGYSERGAINALLFEIAFSNDSVNILRRLIDRALFTDCDLAVHELRSATALVEQSLSDFGDADAILLLDSLQKKSVVFIEGKVKSSQSGPWRLEEQFARFQRGLTSKVDSSNLFTQLYHKVRFTHAARCEGQAPLYQGVPFPACSSKRLRYIGANPVVLRAVERITPYIGDSYYLAIVPDNPHNIRAFVSNTLKLFTHAPLELWDVSRWGFLCWSDVHDFCRAEGLTTASAVLEFNKGQIY